jgi:hypothetical protein
MRNACYPGRQPRTRVGIHSVLEEDAYPRYVQVLRYRGVECAVSSLSNANEWNRVEPGTACSLAWALGVPHGQRSRINSPTPACPRVEKIPHTQYSVQRPVLSLASERFTKPLAAERASALPSPTTSYKTPRKVAAAAFRCHCSYTKEHIP